MIFLGHSHGASLAGNNIAVVHGSGHYAGTNIRHYGGGNPTVEGQDLRIFGYQDTGHIRGDQQIVIGSMRSGHSIADQAVVFSAPGGFKFIQGIMLLLICQPMGELGIRI